MSSSYLVPGTGTDGTQLWIVTVADNGTATSHELADLNPGAPSYYSAFKEYGTGVLDPFFVPFNGGFLFVASGFADETPGAGYGAISATGTQTGREMWFTDGTQAGTHLVFDANQGSQIVNYNGQSLTFGNDGLAPGSDPQTVVIGSTALFLATIGVGQTALYATDGTGGNATPLVGSTAFTNPTSLFALNGEAVFLASVTPPGQNSYGALFGTDGTDNGTHRLSTGSAYNVQKSSTAAGLGEIFFKSGDSQLWVTNGATATQLTSGTSTVQNVGGSGQLAIDLGNGTSLFFRAPAAATGLDLWKTDGTVGGTLRVAQGVSPSASPSLYAYGSFVTAGGTHEGFFETPGANGPTLWVSDGTAGGTTRIAAWSNTTGGTAVAGHRLLFVSSDANANLALNSTDGTLAGTTVLETSGAGALHAGPSGDVVFSETDANGNVNLFVTDGTGGGTHQVTTGLNNFGGYTAAGQNFFVTAYDSTGAQGVWVVGASGNAVELNIAGDHYPTALTALGNDIFFTATSPSSGASESWISNGTTTSRTQGGAVLTAGGSTGSFVTVLPCFLAGTRLRTPDGETAVEDLREGDLLLTASGAAAPIVWVGDREVDLARHPAPERVRPVRVRAHAFGPGLPARDVRLSPDHALFLDGALIPVQHLIDGVAITQEVPRRAHYFHVELKLHDVVLAEGLPVETYLETGNRAAFMQAGDTAVLHPDFWALHWEGACAPLVVSGPKLEAARARLGREKRAMAA